MRDLLLTILITMSFFSCSDDDGSFNGVEMRIRNRSNIIFDEIFVDSGSSSRTYNRLLPGQTSTYESFDNLYRYAYVRISSGENEYILQPIDYVGEIPLAPGKYTYELDISDPDFIYSVALELHKD